MTAGLKITLPSVAFTYDKRMLRRTMLSAGQEVAAIARGLIRSSAGSGRQYGKHRASAPGQPPASLSGKLAASIKARLFRSGEGVSIRDSEFYALFLQGGAKGGGGATRTGGYRRATGAPVRRMKKSAVSRTRVLAPRPFLTTALEQRKSSIESRIKAAVLDGIKFQRIPAGRKV